MKKSEEELRKLIREQTKKLLESHYNDGEHAVQKLREVNKFSGMLLNEIDVGDELPEWIMDKFAVAANDMNEIYQYLSHDPDETQRDDNTSNSFNRNNVN